MKRYWILVLLCLFVIAVGYGQHKAIDFREAEWKDILCQARKEQRIVFVDCYTSWCGPCKAMAKEVFTQDSVADFFNRHFVCKKLDMEKEGKTLREIYQVHAYPTFLFIDPKTEKVVHCRIGYIAPQAFIEEGRNALSPQDNLMGLEQRYEAGERTVELMEKYLGHLKNSGQEQKRDQVMEIYCHTLTDEQFTSVEMWRILDAQLDFRSSPFSYVYQRFMALRKSFYTIAEQQMVDLRLDIVIGNYMARYVRWKVEKGDTFDIAGCDRLITYLQTVDYPKVPGWLAQLFTAEYMGKRDYSGMLRSMKEALKYHFMDESEQQYFLSLFLGEFANCPDKVSVRDVLEWLQEWEKIYPEDQILLFAKARLLETLGETAEAGQIRLKLQKNKQGR